MKKFPLYNNHAEASCFNCDGDFGPDGWYSDSKNADGNGRWMQHCVKCSMATWYDVKKES